MDKKWQQESAHPETEGNLDTPPDDMEESPAEQVVSADVTKEVEATAKEYLEKEEPEEDIKFSQGVDRIDQLPKEWRKTYGI